MILVAADTVEFDEAPALRLRMGQLQPAMKAAGPSWAVARLVARLARITKALSRQALEALPDALDGERPPNPAWLGTWDGKPAPARPFAKSQTVRDQASFPS